MNTPTLAGKFLYGFLFVIVIPLLLWIWAVYASPYIDMPVVQSYGWGYALVLIGVMLIIWGMGALYFIGKGLPMNAYPPATFVRKNIYKYISHPIYVGFALLCVGVSLIEGSVGGFWLVSPSVMLGSAALVWGYEIIDLKQRFQDTYAPALLAVPPDQSESPEFIHRLAAIGWGIVPGVLGYLGISMMLASPLWETSRMTDIGEGTMIIELLALGWVLVSLFVARKKSDLHQFAVSGLVLAGGMVWLAVLFPEFGAKHSWVHIGYTFLAARIFVRTFPKRKYLVIVLTVSLTLVLLMNSESWLMNLVSGTIAGAIAFFYKEVWEWLRNGAEKIANSWQEWIFGPVRVINHGFYAGGCGVVGLILAGTLAGPENVFPIALFATIGLIVSAVWAQLLEGSDKLKRPFGYYGGLAGGIVGAGIFYLLGMDLWLMIGIFSVSMPWVQAVGRLRCLVNGCCHGKEAPEILGIHYYHPRSRVCGLSKMKGLSLHPTPLYAILWLFVVGAVLIKMWFAGVSYSFLLGLYLILTGMGRFVEEAYRGEVQTSVLRGLRLYQWIALFTVVLGTIFTTVETATPSFTPVFSWEMVLGALYMGLVNFFAMGVDFPGSNRRFSRLV